MCWVDIIEFLMENEIKDSACYSSEKTHLEENVEIQ